MTDERAELLRHLHRLLCVRRIVLEFEAQMRASFESGRCIGVVETTGRVHVPILPPEVVLLRQLRRQGVPAVRAWANDQGNIEVDVALPRGWG